MDIRKTISEINASFEAAVLQHIGATAAVGAQEISLSERFFGAEWGVAEWNLQRQKWRWLGPGGQSHLYLKLDPNADYLVRIYVHTIASEPVLDALTALVNGTPPIYQGLAVDANGVVSQWCIVDRERLERHNGIAKITWSLLPGPEAPRKEQMNGQANNHRLLKSIAFSKVTCEPYSILPTRTARQYDIQLTEPFAGTAWGGLGWNQHHQRWRWLGSDGRSHLYLKLDSTADHFVRIHVHTAPPEELVGLSVLINGKRCRYQGLEMSRDDVWSKWCLITRQMVAKNDGVVKITWSLQPSEEASQGTSTNGKIGFVVAPIAFTHVSCESVSRVAAGWRIGTRLTRRALRGVKHATQRNPSLTHDGPILRGIRH